MIICLTSTAGSVSLWCVCRGVSGLEGLCLGFTYPVRTGGVCLCLVRDGVGGVGGKWVGALDQGLEGWVLLCLCEMWVWIIGVYGRSRYLCVVLGASEVHLVFNIGTPAS